MPAGVYIRRIAPSQHAENTVYAGFDNHQNGDFKPYLLKSTDKGATWTSIAGDLPDADGLLALMGQDKKVIDGRLRFILARGIGQAFVAEDVPMDVVRAVLSDALRGR